MEFNSGFKGLIAIRLTKPRELLLTANSKCGDRCTACRHGKRFQSRAMRDSFQNIPELYRTGGEY